MTQPLRAAVDLSDRFLIALAKFLGESPRDSQSAGAGWVPTAVSANPSHRQHFQECLDRILGNACRLDLGAFNRLMLQCGRPLAANAFFEFFFSKVDAIEAFEQAVERFRVKSMLLCGNFRFGYRLLAEASPDEFGRLITSTEPTLPEVREPFDEIQLIPEEDLYLLGYVSSDRTDFSFCRDLVKVLRDNPPISDGLAMIGPEKQAKASAVLGSDVFPAVGDCGLSLGRLTSLYEELDAKVKTLDSRFEAAVEIGARNTFRYLTMPWLDVYLATSMRNVSDFVAHRHFVQGMFAHPAVSDLHLRYFDPTLSYADNRITKGLIEALMLRRAKVTIYNAGQVDTLGKDSELASTLAQGKPVIAYVPPEEDERAKKLENHPLGLQTDRQTGVAHGLFIVRSVAQCADVLSKVLLRTLHFSIRHEQGNYLLVEEDTKSVVRVVSDDVLLTRAFWTFFRQEEREYGAAPPEPIALVRPTPGGVAELAG